jgi:hypothetical protein
MQVSIEWIEKWFTAFNKDYFGGKLPLPDLALSKSRTRLGSMSCKHVTRFGRTKVYDFAIRISNYYDMTERQFQNVLLHEMIHYSITYTGLKDTSPHGVVFRGMAEAMNKKYGWDIRVMVSTRNVKIADDKILKPFLVLALELQTGERLLTVVNPKYAKKVDSMARGVKRISRFAWYITKDKYFIKYPQVRALRGRRVTLDVYEDKISEMNQVII